MPTVFQLSQVRDWLHVRQSELARMSGVSLRTINHLCLNRTAQVSLATLDEIAGALKVEPGELMAREKRSRKP